MAAGEGVVCDGGALSLLGANAEGSAVVTGWPPVSPGCLCCAGWLRATRAGFPAGSLGEQAGRGRNLPEPSGTPGKVVASGRAVPASGYSFVP